MIDPSLPLRLGSEIDQLRERIRSGVDRRRMQEATLFVDEIDRLRAELATLRAKMATMVCGTCKGDGEVPIEDSEGTVLGFQPCLICQPAKDLANQQKIG